MMAFELPDYLSNLIKALPMEISQLAEVIPGIIIFRICELEFCINVKDVYLIKRTEEFESLRDDSLNGTAYIMIYNFNIPIIDISKNLDLPAENNKNRRMILIIRHHSDEDNLEKTFGILVDEVIELITTDKSDDNYLLRFTPSNINPYLSGSIYLGEREILLPNFSKIAAKLFMNGSSVQL